MNNIEITIVDAIRIAATYLNVGDSEMCCVRAAYEDGFFVLTLQTLFQKYEFYVHASSGEVVGVSSEPLCLEDAYCGDIA